MDRRFLEYHADDHMGMVTCACRLAGVVCLVLMAATGCRRDPVAVRDEHLAKGDALFQDGRFPQATVEYQSAVTADPNSSDARQRLAESYVRIGMVEFAIKEYSRAATLAPSRADLHMQTATLLLAASRFEEAETFARKSVALGPATGAAHLLLGNALVGLSSVTDAAATIRLDPASPDAAARFREAEAEYRAAIAREPDAPLPYVALGRLLEALGRQGDAETEYRRALAIKAGEVAARRALARLFLNTNRLKDAEAELRALADALGTPAGYVELADYYIALGRLADARPILESLMDRVTTFAAARIRLAVLEFEAGRLTRAHELADEVLEQLSGDPKASLLKARLFRSEGRIDDALMIVRSVLNTDRNSVVARRELASLYVIKHNRDEAVRVLSGGTPGSREVEVQLDLARLYLDRMDATRARAAATRAMAISPGFPPARALLVRALVSAGDLAGAQDAFTAIPAAASSLVDVLVAQGDLEAARGAPAAARRAYARALAANSANPDALKAIVQVEISERRFAAARAHLAPPRGGAEASGAAALRLRLTAVVVAAEGHLPKAQEMLRAIVDQDAADADAWLALAGVRQRMGLLPQAQAAAEQAVVQQPGWPHATLVLGGILEAQGKAAEARGRYEQLLKMDPDAADVRKRLTGSSE